MAKKELSIFGASFLDLLSGALGAVIILYVIVPKLNIPVDEFEEQQRIADEINQLGLSISELSGLIPQEEYDRLTERVQTITVANAALEAELAYLHSKLGTSEDNEEKIAGLLQQAEDLRAEVQQARAELAECTDGLAQCSENMEVIEGENRFMVVILSWEVPYHDVDLHIVDPMGNEFMYTDQSFPGVNGELTVDNTCGPGFEVWNITAPASGDYEVYANLFSKNGCEGGNPDAGEAEVTIYHRNGVQKYSEIELNHEDEKVLVSAVSVTGSGSLIFN